MQLLYALSMSILDTPTLGRVCKLPKLFPCSSGAAPGTLVDSKQRGMLVCSVLLSILCRGVNIVSLIMIY